METKTKPEYVVITNAQRQRIVRPSAEEMDSPSAPQVRVETFQYRLGYVGVIDRVVRAYFDQAIGTQSRRLKRRECQCEDLFPEITVSYDPSIQNPVLFYDRGPVIGIFDESEVTVLDCRLGMMPDKIMEIYATKRINISGMTDEDTRNKLGIQLLVLTALVSNPPTLKGLELEIMRTSITPDELRKAQAHVDLLHGIFRRQRYQ